MFTNSIRANIAKRAVLFLSCLLFTSNLFPCFWIPFLEQVQCVPIDDCNNGVAIISTETVDGLPPAGTTVTIHVTGTDGYNSTQVVPVSNTGTVQATFTGFGGSGATYTVSGTPSSNACGSIITTTFSFPTSETNTFGPVTTTNANCGDNGSVNFDFTTNLCNPDFIVTATHNSQTFPGNQNGIFNLAPGSYAWRYRVEDCQGNLVFTDTGIAVVGGSGPGPTLSLVSQRNVTCSGGSDGQIVVSSTGGNGAITYFENNNPGGPTFNNLPANNYLIRATDSAGCASLNTLSVHLTAPGPVSGSEELYKLLLAKDKARVRLSLWVWA